MPLPPLFRRKVVDRIVPESGPVIPIEELMNPNPPAPQHSAEARAYAGRAAVTMRPAAGEPDTFITDTRPPCAACKGTGRILTINDWLRELCKHLPVDDPAALDGAIRTFYGELLTEWPDMVQLFPVDIVTGAMSDPESPGWEIRDRLLGALLALLADYDPDHVQSEGMDRLRTILGVAGRSHTAFARLDGTTDGARLDEYEAVRTVLVRTLRSVVGAENWRREYDRAIGSAFQFAMAYMLHAQEEWLREHDGQVHARAPRPLRAS